MLYCLTSRLPIKLQNSVVLGKDRQTDQGNKTGGPGTVYVHTHKMQSVVFPQRFPGNWMGKFTSTNPVGTLTSLYGK